MSVSWPNICKQEGWGETNRLYRTKEQGSARLEDVAAPKDGRRPSKKDSPKMGITCRMASQIVWRLKLL